MPAPRSSEKPVKRVLLINPPQTYSEQSFDYSLYFPIGLMSVAANIRDLCEVSIYDCLLREDEVTLLEDGFVRYGAGPETLRQVIEERRPDLIGVALPFTAQYNNGRDVLKLCREVVPGVPLIVGGPDPSVRFRQILEEGLCDYCVVAEGEETFREFVGCFVNGRPLERIQGVARRTEDGIEFERREYLKDLDELKPPALDLVDVDKYRKSVFLYRNRSGLNKNSISVFTSRGCPYECVFCSIQLHMGKKYRFHSTDYVIDYIRTCVEHYGITNFHFEDDNFSLHRKHFDRLLDAMLDSGLEFKWDTPNGLRADSLDRDLLVKMKKTGCVRAILAFESGSQRVLDEVIKKSTDLSYMIEIAKLCHDVGISTRIFFVIGFPGESLEEMQQTIDLALEMFEKYAAIPSLMVATPLYGTELYDQVMEHGYVDHPPTSEELASATQVNGAPMISTPEWSKQDVKELLDRYTLRLRSVRRRHALRDPRFAMQLISNRLRRYLRIRSGKRLETLAVTS